MLSGASVNRDEVLERIREHLATELEIDGSSISDATRFREDLEADSLDLVELTVELEDQYGIRIPDDEAARIATFLTQLDPSAFPVASSG